MNLFHKSNNKEYGGYPCNDYLNNALRFLMNACDSGDVDLQVLSAIHEICYAISKAQGKFYDDVKAELMKRKFWPWQ